MWPPETTSFGNGAAAAASSGISASCGGARPSRPRALLERAREAVRHVERAADDRQEPAQELLRRVAASAANSASIRATNAVDGRIAARDAERRRLDDRQRAEHRAAAAASSAITAAVGVPAEVVARPEEPGELGGLLVEVDPLERGFGRKSRPVPDDELEAARPAAAARPRSRPFATLP